MAASVTTIELIKRYIPYLDEVYRQASATSVLDIDNSLIREGATAKTVVIPIMDMDGLADYSRNNGYVDRATKLTYKENTYNNDRGGRYQIDSMDDAETDSVAFGKLSAQLMRDKVVPELDAYRFATYASADQVTSKEMSIETAEAGIAALREGMNTMDENEVSGGRILFITPTIANMINDMDTYHSKAIMSEFSQVIKVPQRRFYTAIDLLDGTTADEEVGGFKKAEGAQEINFMIVEKSAIIQHTKHMVNKIITPEQNQSADAYMLFMRFYGIAEVCKNKTAGIYVSKKPAAE